MRIRDGERCRERSVSAGDIVVGLLVIAFSNTSIWSKIVKGCGWIVVEVELNFDIEPLWSKLCLHVTPNRTVVEGVRI